VKLHRAGPAGVNTFTGYGPGYVQVNTERREKSLVVLPDQLLDWPPAGFDELAAAHLQSLLELRPEIVLLGTGEQQRFPRPELTRALRDAGIGVEVMTVAAACRTYNILVAEERRVAAALLLG
jgi:uncharacterized protein